MSKKVSKVFSVLIVLWYIYFNQLKQKTMKSTLDFLINKNVDYVIDILSSNLNVERSTLEDKFLKYDYSGTEYFDKVFREIVGVSIWEIKEINWYLLCDAYDLMGESYPSEINLNQLNR